MTEPSLQTNPNIRKVHTFDEKTHYELGFTLKRIDACSSTKSSAIFHLGFRQEALVERYIFIKLVRNPKTYG